MRLFIALQNAHFRAVQRFEERGATSVEYALMMAMIAVSCISAFTYFRKANSTVFNRSGNAMNTAIG
jgi:Flp pilus assembly pilin Flp